jgi:hypothetical protein
MLVVTAPITAVITDTIAALANRLTDVFAGLQTDLWAVSWHLALGTYELLGNCQLT